MRRYSFFIGALSAVITFVALSAFSGRRPWNHGSRWPYGWHRHDCGDDSSAGGRYRGGDRDRSPDRRSYNSHQQPPVAIDSASGARQETADSVASR